MKVYILMENTPYNDDYLFEHGLSIYVETDAHKLLIDTGSTEKTWINAEKLNIDISKVDTLILSHGHYDHAGGILSFYEKNQHAKIYLHKNAGLDYYSENKEGYKYIGINKDILKLNTIHYIENDTAIDDEISIFTNVVEREKWPDSNLRLKKYIHNQYIQDDFSHEQYVVLHVNHKNYLISGCAHNGIINILHRYHDIYKSYPDVVMSGFHLKKRREYNEKEIHLIKEIANELKTMPTIFYTGHCTGIPGYEILKEIMGNQLQYMHAGERII